MTTPDLVKSAELSEEAQALLRPDLSPSKYIDVLTENKLYKDAIKFLAHGLPIQLTIKWGCACVDELSSPGNKKSGEKCLDAAKTWVASPSDDNRRKAKAASDEVKEPAAEYLIALAVFYSGGSITPLGAQETPPPPFFGNRMAANSIQIAVLSDDPPKKEQRFKRALDIGRDLVRAETAKPATP